MNSGMEKALWIKNKRMKGNLHKGNATFPTARTVTTVLRTVLAEQEGSIKKSNYKELPRLSYCLEFEGEKEKKKYYIKKIDKNFNTSVWINNRKNLIQFLSWKLENASYIFHGRLLNLQEQSCAGNPQMANYKEILEKEYLFFRENWMPRGGDIAASKTNPGKEQERNPWFGVDAAFPIPAPVPVSRIVENADKNSFPVFSQGNSGQPKEMLPRTSLFLSMVTAVSALSDPLDIWINSRCSCELPCQKFFYSRFMDQCIVAFFSTGASPSSSYSKFVKMLQTSPGAWKFSKCISSTEKVPFLGGVLIRESVRKQRGAENAATVPAMVGNNIYRKSWKWKIPWNVLIRFCQNEKYFHQNSGKPVGIPYLVHRTHAEILTHYKKLIFLFYLYYNPIQDHKTFSCLVDGLKESCILTLALKYKLKSGSQIIQKFGYNLKCQKTKKKWQKIGNNAFSS